MNDLPTPWAHFADGGAHYEAYGPLTPNTRAARPIRSTHDLRAPLCPSPQGRPSQPVHRAHGATIQNPAAAADFAPAFPAAARPAQTSPPSPIGGNVRTERAAGAGWGRVRASVGERGGLCCLLPLRRQRARPAVRARRPRRAHAASSASSSLAHALGEHVDGRGRTALRAQQTPPNCVALFARGGAGVRGLGSQRCLRSIVCGSRVRLRPQIERLFC